MRRERLIMTTRLKLYDDRRPDAVCGPGVHFTGYLCDGCAEEQAAKVVRFVKKVMVVGMDEVLNPGWDSDHPDRVPEDVEVEVVESWGD
jgi:hypothetical protein